MKYDISDIDLTHEHKTRCPKCAEHGNDKSGNNLHVYGLDGEGLHRGAHCFRAGCGFTIRDEKTQCEEGGYELVGKPFTEDVIARIRNLSTDPDSYRGLTQETCRVYNTRHEYIDGKLHAQYHMATQAYKCSGFKLRIMPKDFDSYGTTGKACEMFGQYAFRNSNSKTVVVVGGEIDAMSAYQMLYNSQKSKEYEAIPVVSSTTGEGGTAAQLAAQYEWLNRFEKVILCLDNDDAGRKATEECVAALPKGKAYKMDLTLKDANEYLTSFREREFVQAFWSAKQIVPAGVVGSDELYARVLENANIDYIPLPLFMKDLEDMMGGGIPLGYIVNFASASGAGKTTIVNEMIYHWVFNSPHMIGVVSMELDAGQYGESMLSRHLGRKISLFNTKEERIAFLESEEVKLRAKELFQKSDGSPRWHLLDDRDGSLEGVQAVIEQLVISCGCKVIVIDPLQDLLDGLSNEDQAIFMRWQKRMVKSHKITFINISHVRKNQAGQAANSAGGFLSEEDMSGSSTIFKSGGANVLFGRNKYAEDPVERNTIKSVMSKCRWTGLTGPSGDWYYDNIKHTMINKRDWEEMVNRIPDDEDLEQVADRILEAAQQVPMTDYFEVGGVVFSSEAVGGD